MRKWSGTLMVLDTWTTDGRRVASPLISLRHRALPLPLVVSYPPVGPPLVPPFPPGRIDSLKLVPADGANPAHVWATGTIDLDDVRDIDPEVADHLAAGEPCGVGADLDQVVAVEVPREPAPRGAGIDADGHDALAVVFHEPTAPPPDDEPPRLQVNGWRIMFARLYNPRHNTPAWPQCVITLHPADTTTGSPSA